MVLIKVSGQDGTRTCGITHDTGPKTTLLPTEQRALVALVDRHPGLSCRNSTRVNTEILLNS